MKTISKFTLIILGLLIIIFIIWYSNVGKKKLYYIQEVNLYIKTFPSRETTIIAFSNNKINEFSDTLDYIKVYKGENYGTVILLDPNEKNTIYISGNGIEETNWQKYREGKNIASRDTVYFEYKVEGGYLLKAPYVEIAFNLCGAEERILKKNRNDIYYTEMEAIN